MICPFLVKFWNQKTKHNLVGLHKQNHNVVKTVKATVCFWHHPSQQDLVCIQCFIFVGHFFSQLIIWQFVPHFLLFPCHCFKACKIKSGSTNFSRSPLWQKSVSPQHWRPIFVVSVPTSLDGRGHREDCSWEGDTFMRHKSSLILPE